MARKINLSTLPDLDLSILNVKSDDPAALKLLMLIEGAYGLGVKHSTKKYGYSEPRYYQLLREFQQSGSIALFDKKRGPKSNSQRTEKVVQLIIRHRFLDPAASAAVIAQKLNQQGHSISSRSVERTIQEYGLQKKTLPAKSG
jgi:transposase